MLCGGNICIINSDGEDMLNKVFQVKCETNGLFNAEAESKEGYKHNVYV